MSRLIERYESLKLREALTRSYHYPEACKELSLILRQTYQTLPKDLQSIIFQDILDAFRLLPEVQTERAVYAAQLLLQGAEAALPKQKKTIAVKKFKQAKIALKRRSKVEQEGKGAIELPEDVLLHIFGFLDVQSLFSAGLVCKSWKFAASRNQLWKSQYDILFAHKEWSFARLFGDKEPTLLDENMVTNTDFDWREAFKQAYIGNSSKKLISVRAYCGNCVAVVWANNMRCCNRDCKQQSQSPRILPLSTSEVVEYLNHGSLSIMSSESDTDDEGGLFQLPNIS